MKKAGGRKLSNQHGQKKKGSTLVMRGIEKKSKAAGN